MPKYYTPEYVGSVLALHDWECVFELDAPRKIAERLQHRTKDEWLGYTPNSVFDWDIYEKTILPEFKRCFQLSEIYCPHEGIDRRVELEVSTDWV